MVTRKQCAIFCTALLFVQSAQANDLGQWLNRARQAREALESLAPPANKPQSQQEAPRAPSQPTQPSQPSAASTPSSTPAVPPQANDNNAPKTTPRVRVRPPDPSFVPPQSIVKQSEGDRVMKRGESGSADGPAKTPLTFAPNSIAIVANPYVIHTPVQFTPGATLGHELYPGFFYTINGFRVLPDDSMLVSGTAGYREARPNEHASSRYTYAEGCWRVAPDGAISPINVTRFSTSGADVPCDIRVTGRLDPARWEAAMQTVGASNFMDGVEDKHGNIWVATNCAMHKFTSAGEHQVVLDTATVCPNDHRQRISPHYIAYDRVADELVIGNFLIAPSFSHGGIWRISQTHQVREVYRWHLRGPPLDKARQLHKGAAEGLRFLAVDSKGRIWFQIEPAGNRFSMLRTEAGSDKIVQVVGTSERGYRDGPLSAPAAISELVGLSGFDSSDNLLVSSQPPRRGIIGTKIRKVETSANRVVTWIH
jgi:hypothetical protein